MRERPSDFHSILRMIKQVHEEEAERTERKARRLDRQRQRRHALRMRDGTPGDDCIPAGWLLLVLAAVAAAVVWLVMGRLAS